MRAVGPVEKREQPAVVALLMPAFDAEGPVDFVGREITTLKVRARREQIWRCSERRSRVIIQRFVVPRHRLIGKSQVVVRDRLGMVFLQNGDEHKLRAIAGQYLLRSRLERPK